jgi:uncharacterized protein (UPF0332 family)
LTEPNKRENIGEELSRSQRALAEANLLYNNGYLNGAVSRLYYSLLYTIRALLFSRGLEPKSHEGALRLFAREFVKKGVFTSGSSHVFARLMKYREEADYNPSYSFTPQDYRGMRQEAEALADKVSEHLRQEGYQ